MSRRILRVNELIKTELGKIIFKKIELPDGVFLNIVEVSTAPDLSQANIYISVFPEQKMNEAMIILKKNIFEIQRLLNRKLVMRKVPKISFFEEKKLIEAGRLEKIFSELEK